MTHETRPTATEREINWMQLIQVALDTPGSVGDVYNRFYDYSFMNQMLLRMQGVNEPVATYKRWQRLGRQVLKGSKAYAIVRPITIQRRNEEDEVEARLTRFKPVKCLFGVSQTDGADLPPVQLRGWDLDQARQQLGVREVPFDHLDGNTQGYSVGREYAINPVAVDPAHTTFHELGHIVLGHTALSTEADADYAAHRGVKEFQAEATAYLTLNELERLTPDSASRSRGYIQSWLHGEHPSDQAIRQVFVATDTILKAGRAALEVDGDLGV